MLLLFLSEAYYTIRVKNSFHVTLPNTFIRSNSKKFMQHLKQYRLDHRLSEKEIRV